MRSSFIFLAGVIVIGGYGYDKNSKACQKLGFDIVQDTTAIFAPSVDGVSSVAVVPSVPTTATTQANAQQDADPEIPASMRDWDTDSYAQAVAMAQKRGKKLLLFFTGSDYCPPCQETVRDVFPTAVFQNFVSSSYIMVTLDYPRYKKQSAELIEQNRALHQKYNIRGVPTFIITDVDGTEIKRSLGGTSNANFLIWTLGGTP